MNPRHGRQRLRADKLPANCAVNSIHSEYSIKSTEKRNVAVIMNIRMAPCSSSIPFADV